MKKHTIEETSQFIRDIKRFRKEHQVIRKLVSKIETLRSDPFDKSLRTHKVNLPEMGKVYSSRVTGDLRLIWTFNQEKHLVIVALRFGGHDEVY